MRRASLSDAIKSSGGSLKTFNGNDSTLVITAIYVRHCKILKGLRYVMRISLDNTLICKPESKYEKSTSCGLTWSTYFCDYCFKSSIQTIHNRILIYVWNRQSKTWHKYFWYFLWFTGRVKNGSAFFGSTFNQQITKNISLFTAVFTVFTFDAKCRLTSWYNDK